MLNKNSLKKFVAVFALMGFVGTTSLVNVSEAATPRRTAPVKHTQTVRRPAPKPVVVRKAPVRRPTPVVYSRPAPHRESHSDTGNLVTGLLLGGVLGAIIANNS